MRLLALLETIATNPPQHDGAEQVHRLRTTTRRFEVMLAERARADRIKSDFPKLNCPKKVSRSLKKIRRKAGDVRDIDVHLELLRGALLKATASRAERGAQSELRQVLTASRERHLVRLARAVRKAAPLLEQHLPRLAEQAAHHISQPQDVMRKIEARQIERARQRFLRWTRQVPEEPGELHALRIRTKQLRYALEALGDNPEALAMAAQLQRVQDAIGAWHDWATLERLAGRELKQSHAQPLCRELERRTQNEYLRARRTASEVRECLQQTKGEPLPETINPPARKPPRRHGETAPHLIHKTG